MANKKITDLPELAEAPNDNDLFEIVDVSTGTNKRIKAQYLGGGGSQTLQEVSDTGGLSNGSTLKQGTTDAGYGGNKGIALKCSVDYELKWEAGRLYIMEQDGFTIREVSHNFTVIPAVTDDTTKGFVVGSRWLLDNGTLYTCSDNTTGSAVWNITVSGTPTLQEVTDEGSVTTNGITITGATSTANINSTDGFSYASDVYFSSLGQGIGVFDINGNSINLNTDIGISLTTNNLFSSTIKADLMVTEDKIHQLPSESGTIALTSDIPTNTSDLINDGDDGNPFISLLDLPSNIIFYPTNVASDISGYVKIVTSITDPDYNTTAVDVSTGAITTTNQLISSLATSPNIIVGNPGVFNITTIGNIRRISGTGEASLYFQVYKRTSAGVETLIATSDNTLPVLDSGTYVEFSSTAIWDDGIFSATDRIVMKYYANRISGGSNPTYEFQFGGVTPVRTLVPIPLSVVPVLTIDAVPTDGSTNAVSSNGVFDAFENHDFETLINDQLSYFIPVAGVATFPSLLRSGTPTLSGNTAVFESPTNILFSTTAIAGTLANQRGTAFYLSLALISKVNFYRKFKFNSNVTDTRFFCGISNMYGAAAPTNVAPNTQINTIGICKMATSQNLQVVHNDATGTATLIDLGVNYPANNVVDYWYTLQILKTNNSTNISIIVTRTDNTGASITSTTVISSDYNNTLLHYPAMWITNNATASIASYKDFGCVSKFNQLF